MGDMSTSESTSRDGADGAAEGSAPKRRRLSRKQARPAAFVLVSEGPEVRNTGADREPGAPLISQSVQGSAELSKQFLNKYNYWWKRKTKHSLRTPRYKMEIWRRYALREKSPEEKVALVGRFVAENPRESCLAEAYLMWVNRPKQPVGKGVYSLLLTWMPEFGIVWSPEAQESSAPGPEGTPGAREPRMTPERPIGSRRPPSCRVGPEYPVGCPQRSSLEGLEGEGRKGVTMADFHFEKNVREVEKLAAFLRGVPRVAEAWAHFQAQVQEWTSRLVGHFKGSWCFEVCPKAWECDGTIRLHAHLALIFSSKQRCPEHSDFLWAGSAPHDRKADPQGRVRNMFASLYYLHESKASCVFSDTTAAPHVAYPVSASWIWASLEGGKTSYEAARAELGRIPNGIVRNLQNLESWRQLRIEASVREYRQWRARHSDEQKKPWRYYDQIARWLGQYEKILDRYHFLVLDGPSQVGKTAYCRELAPEGGLLEVSLAGGAAIDLKAYDPSSHEVILFDEAEPQQIVDAKKLIQAGPGDVALQTSKTNCHSYSVCVAGKKFVVCSNVWEARLRRLASEDADWLRDNSYLVKIQGPMWHTAPMESLPTTQP